MKTELIIKQGHVKIVLICENDFERDMVENIKDSKVDYRQVNTVLADYDFGGYNNHRIEIELIENEST